MVRGEKVLVFNMMVSFLFEPLNVEHILQFGTQKYIGDTTYVGKDHHLF
jgi:hypothetical protein